MTISAYSQRTRRYYPWLGLSALFLLTPACSDTATDGDEASDALIFMWIPKELDNDVFRVGYQGATRQAQTLSQSGEQRVNIIYEATNSASDVEGQAELVRGAVDRNVAGVAVSCSHPEGLQEAIDEVVEAGIPVMTFDSDSPSSQRFTYLGIDNEAGGALGARILGETMGQASHNEVAIVSGVRGAANLEARVSGFKAAIGDDYPDLEVVDTVFCDDDASEGARLIEQLLTDYPHLGGLFVAGLWPLFACDGTDCSGSMPLWDAAAQSGAVATVVFDTLSFELDFVDNGMIAGLIGQKYWGWGYDGVEILHDRVVYGKEFPDFSDSGIDVVCANNVGEMAQMWREVDFLEPLTPCRINGTTVE